MSTKIYDAYVSELSILELLPKFIKIAPKIKKTCINEVLEDVYELAVFSFDKQNKEKTFDEIKDKYYREISKEERGVNNGLLVMLYPFESKTYMLFFGKTKHIEIIENEIELKDFHFQDQSDKPEEISDKDWYNRLEIWDKILGGDGYGKPIDYGLQFTFADKQPCQYYDFLTAKNVKIPSDEKRAERLVIYDNRNKIDKNRPYSSIEEIKNSENFKELVSAKIAQLPVLS